MMFIYVRIILVICCLWIGSEGVVSALDVSVSNRYSRSFEQASADVSAVYDWYYKEYMRIQAEKDSRLEAVAHMKNNALRLDAIRIIRLDVGQQIELLRNERDVRLQQVVRSEEP